MVATVYSIDRHYGGPEEGGWWYNWYCVDENTPSAPIMPGWEEDDDYKDALYAEMLANFTQPKYSIYSMANDGPQYTVIFEDYRGERASKEIPHYE